MLFFSKIPRFFTRTYVMIHKTSFPNKVKLMKSLWYSDVLSFIRTGKSMSGLVYRHEAMGALPIGHYSLMNLENINIKEEMSYNYDSMLHIYPSNNVDYSLLNEVEKTILNDVINKFIHFNITRGYASHSLSSYIISSTISI